MKELVFVVRIVIINRTGMAGKLNRETIKEITDAGLQTGGPLNWVLWLGESHM